MTFFSLQLRSTKIIGWLYPGGKVCITGCHVTSCNQGLSSNDQGRQRTETLGTRLNFSVSWLCFAVRRLCFAVPWWVDFAFLWAFCFAWAIFVLQPDFILFCCVELILCCHELIFFCRVTDSVLNELILFCVSWAFSLVKGQLWLVICVSKWDARHDLCGS